MNRNTKSFESNAINLDIKRSTFNRNQSIKTSFDVGEVVPFFVDEVLPGDTHKVNTSKVVRLQTLITPVMDNIYLDTYYFFVPNRLVWEHWKNFNGENTASAWIPSVEYEVPQLTAPATGWNVGTIADYFGIPTGVAGLSVNALPFRAYALIMNEWFRDQNLQQPLSIPVSDSTVTGVNTGTYVTDVAKGGLPFKASKYRDYFTSCLPAPQKGPDIGIGLTGNIDVYGTGKSIVFTTGGTNFGTLAGTNLTADRRPPTYGSNATYRGVSLPATLGGSTNVSYGDNILGIPTKAQLATQTFTSGMYADLGSATAISINSLRMAFQLQKLYEKDARGGSRYIEIIKSHFGVTSPDARQQRPEYLGGNRIPVNINQVVQMSESGTTPIGETGAYSLTTDFNGDFVKSFTEHGFIIGLMVARYDHTYQQGLERFWTRKERFDYYWPVLANIGEQAVLNQEIFASGTSVDNEVFGYQEAWADYRYKPNRVTGEMRSTYATSLDVWHLGDDYSTLPTLSDAWIQEDKTNVDRVLAVTSDVSNQMFADIYVMDKTTRPMPMHSIPGLIDHH